MPLARSLFSISGDDAGSFLQAILSNHIPQSNNQCSYALFLTAQGKYRADLFITRTDTQTLLVDCPSPALPTLLAEWNKLKLRRKLTLSPLPEYYCSTAESLVQTNLTTTIIKDPRHPALGVRIYSPSSHDIEAPTTYHARRMSLAIPDGHMEIMPEQSLPLEFRLDKLHAIDFNKGCYIGQEVTARSKFRATLHKSIFAISSTSPLPAAPQPILHQEREIGQLLGQSGQYGIGMVRIKILDAITNESPATIAGQTIRIHLPDWAL